jgi:hypothetical protein
MPVPVAICRSEPGSDSDPISGHLSGPRIGAPEGAPMFAGSRGGQACTLKLGQPTWPAFLPIGLSRLAAGPRGKQAVKMTPRLFRAMIQT